MNLKPNPAAQKLHQETQRLKALLIAAEAALPEAEAAALEAPPDAQTIGAYDLESARLSDLAGSTVGAQAALERRKADDTNALQSWRGRIDGAKSRAEEAQARVAFYRRSLADARRLELAALSAAAEPMVESSAQAYADAVQAMRAAAVELSAVRAVAHAAYRQRMNDQIGHGDLGAFEAREVRLPIATLGVLGSDGTTNRAATAPDVIHINGNPSALVETIVNTLKGLA